MGMLDYINSESLEYKFALGYFTRYGFDWKLLFFETYFRPDQIGPAKEDPRP
jgi:polypeptide N-acetylgalactosaminyltransferase